MGRTSRAVAALAAAALTIVAGAVALPAAATAPPPEQPPAATCDATPDVEVYRYRKVTPAIEGVREYLYERDTFKTKHEYRKQVRGVVEQRDNGQHTWHTTGQRFDWTWWEPPSTKWAFSLVEVLESGPHSAIVREWTTGNGRKHWRERSTEYRYVPTGTVEQIPTGTESSGWTTDPLTDPWRLVDERWAVEPVAEVVEFYPVEGFTDEALDAPWQVVATDIIPGTPARWQDTDPDGDCYNGPPPVTAPTAGDFTCTDGGWYTIPDVDTSVVYLRSVDGGPWEQVTAGTFMPRPEQQVLVRAVWVGDERVLGEWEFTFRSLEGCVKPEPPEPKVQFSRAHFVALKPECGDTTLTLTRTRTKTTTTYKVIGEPDAWEVVVDEVTVETHVDTVTRPLTPEELAELEEECEVTPPGPPGPPPVTPDDPDCPDEDAPEPDDEGTDEGDEELAETGSAPSAALYSLAALGLGGVLLLVRRRLA